MIVSVVQKIYLSVGLVLSVLFFRLLDCLNFLGLSCLFLFSFILLYFAYLFVFVCLFVLAYLLWKQVVHDFIYIFKSWVVMHCADTLIYIRN